MSQGLVDRTAHSDIVQNPDIKAFLDSCKYMVQPTGKELEMIIQEFNGAPRCFSNLPSKIIAIDGNSYEASVNSQMPYTRFGFVKISNLLIDRDGLKGLDSGRFIDPFAVAKMEKDNSALLFSFPSSNMSYKGEPNVKNGFRLALDEALYKQRFDNHNPQTSIRSTLFYIASFRTGTLRCEEKGKLFLHRCPSCGAEKIEIWDIPEVQKCPFCNERIYPSDCLRIWEEVDDNTPNQLALTRFTNAITHILVIHYIRHLKEHFSNSYLKVLSNMCFFIDGPLSINGNSAWIKSCIQKILYDINVELTKAKLPPLMVVGLQRRGKLYDFIKLIGHSIPSGTICCVSDQFRNDYVDFDKTPSNTTYGNETYYGQDFLLKTKTGKLFVFDVPYPFPNKDNLTVFIREKSNIDNYTNIGEYVNLIEDFESDLCEGAVIPIALAQKYTAISLRPGGKVLDILAQSAVDKQSKR